MKGLLGRLMNSPGDARSYRVAVIDDAGAVVAFVPVGDVDSFESAIPTAVRYLALYPNVVRELTKVAKTYLIRCAGTSEERAFAARNF